jgi:hypothetical protein
LGVELAVQGVLGEELGDGQVECLGDLGEGIERGDGVAVFYAREIAAQQASLLFDVSLREAFLQAVTADRCPNFHHGSPESHAPLEINFRGRKC